MSDGLPFWRPRADSERRKRSALALARAVLAVRDDALLVHTREFLSVAIWKYTACDGKNSTRFRSFASIGQPASVINHEHVVPRKLLIDKMLAAPDRVDEIMA